MYLEHYGLSEPPFSITPDPRFVFLSERHRDALAHLRFGIGQGGSGGFVQLTGEVGTGKTTLSRLLLEQIPDDTRVALVLNPRLSAIELLETICEELHIALDTADGGSLRGSTKALVDALNAYLLDAYARQLRVVLVIDEAQNLSVDALEQVRLLTNLETDTQKLLQIVLLGQPELRDLLAREDLRQLAQRITARYHLTPLDADETGEYLRHRYRVAGGTRFPLTPAAVKRLHARSGGVPRLINTIAERTLLAGYARDVPAIDDALVDAAADETLPARPPGKRLPWPWLATGGALVLALVLALAVWRQPAPPPASTPAKPASPVSTPAPAKTSAAPPAVPLLEAAAFTQALQSGNDTPAHAWKRLLDLWKQPVTAITVDADGTCTPVAATVHCLSGRGRLDRLLALDRPALLRLDGGATPAWGLLLGADAQRVRLALASGVIDVDRTPLQSAWSGVFATLWPGPEGLRQPVGPGNSGPAVVWLQERLSLPGTGRYDASVRTAVRTFQAARGLPADGVAGPETLMALASDAPGPRLMRELK